MIARLLRTRGELGGAATASLCLLAAAAFFYVFMLQPLERKNAALEDAIARAEGPQSAAEKLAGFYRFLERKEETTDWLAKLHAIGRATGVELASASYRTERAGARLERYEIRVPATGSYRQIRDFLQRALGEIPVLSLDQVTLRRESRNDGVVQAELRLSLHRVVGR